MTVKTFFLHDVRGQDEVDPVDPSGWMHVLGLPYCLPFFCYCFPLYVITSLCGVFLSLARYGILFLFSDFLQRCGENE